MMKNVFRSTCLAAALVASGMSTAQAETIVTEWNEMALEAIRITHPGPPIVARAIAITHTCIYDAWAAYDNAAFGSQLGGNLRQPPSSRTDDNRKKAMSFAAYTALVDLFPTEKTRFDNHMAHLGYNPAEAAGAAAGVGKTACQAVLDYRHQDGSNQLGNLTASNVPYADYTGYTPVNTPYVVNDIGRWQPLEINGAVQTFIAPHWGKVKPFALKKYNQFPVTPPAVPGTQAFTEQALEVVAYSAMLNDPQKVIAEYWADGPTSELPPGHWTLFAAHVSERDNHTMGDDAKMFMAVGNAQLDASIATWGYKVEFDYVRPVTAINELFRDQTIEAWAGPGQDNSPILGQNWRPYQAANVVTPPFAEYVSGHSTFSAAGAEVLKRFTGSDVFKHAVTIRAGSSRVEPGFVPLNDVTLTWATFTDAADEAGISRRYGGIHFLDGDLNGRSLGRKIGEEVWKKATALFVGKKY